MQRVLGSVQTSFYCYCDGQIVKRVSLEFVQFFSTKKFLSQIYDLLIFFYCIVVEFNREKKYEDPIVAYLSMGHNIFFLSDTHYSIYYFILFLGCLSVSLSVADRHSNHFFCLSSPSLSLLPTYLDPYLFFSFFLSLQY